MYHFFEKFNYFFRCVIYTIVWRSLVILIDRLSMTKYNRYVKLCNYRQVGLSAKALIMFVVALRKYATERRSLRYTSATLSISR